MIVAAGLRFRQLGEVPPGLYRDEATNGMDAVSVLTGQRQGQSPFYFAENNGREPGYIYLTSLSIQTLGRSVRTVRLAAAVVGTLTTWIVYKLAETWFGRRIGLLAAFLWAITVWPVHLSRIGLRPITLAPMLALTFWLGTIAYRAQKDPGETARRRSAWLWLVTGLVYGTAYYTYLAVRFTPLLIALIILYLYLTGRHKELWPGLFWSASGTVIAILPLLILGWQQPDLLLGRLGQVSIFDPAVNNGDFVGTLWRQIWQALGLFLVEGDNIVRHNPPGRPLFDPLMAIPMLVGLVWCLRNWRRPPAAMTILWTLTMLGPTVLAEDTPHFLRVAGILPGVLLLPALGLSLLWDWSPAPRAGRHMIVLAVLAGSLALTIKDYFIDYGQETTTAYWFEKAARDLATDVNEEPAGTAVYIDRRFEDSWPSVSFLIDPDREIAWYRPDDLPADQITYPSAVYAWPHEALERVAAAFSAPALVFGETGSLAQGDLEAEPYPMYVRYRSSSPLPGPILANFDNAIQLRGAEVFKMADDQISIDLYWSSATSPAPELVAYVHIIGPTGLMGQDDSVPSQGNWPGAWWRQGLLIRDRHVIKLIKNENSEQRQILIGLYDANTRENLPLIDAEGETVGDTWLLPPREGEQQP